MIRIRYACLPQGRHATAVARGRRVFIYFRPGLSREQRRDAVARLQRDARLGYGPPVPSVGLARALAADRAGGLLRDLRAALWHHPLGAIGLAGVLAGAAACYLSLMASPLPPDGAGRPAAPGPAAARQMTGKLVPLAIRPDRWRIPDARPRKQWPAHGGAVTGPDWRAGHRGQPGSWPLRPGGGRQEREALRWWRRHGWRWPPVWQPPDRAPGAAGSRGPGRPRAGGRLANCAIPGDCRTSG